LDGIAPVIVCLFDRERGIGTDSVVINVNELCFPFVRNASGEYYLLDSFLFKLVRLHFLNLLLTLLNAKYFPDVECKTSDFVLLHKTFRNRNAWICL